MRRILILFAIICSFVFVQTQAYAFWPFSYIRLKSPSEVSIQKHDDAKAALHNIIMEYESKNILGLMKNVSERFVSDSFDFEYALRREFSKKAFIEVTYYVDKILFDSKDDVLVTVSYIKRTQDISTSKIRVKKGKSDIILRKENGKYRLWKMKPRFMGS